RNFAALLSTHNMNNCQLADDGSTARGRSVVANETNSKAGEWREVMLPLTAIKPDCAGAVREGVDEDTVGRCAEALRSGGVFPAVDVYHDGKDYWLADGGHRHASHERAGRKEIRANVRQGTKRDATLHAAGANESLQRRPAEKRLAVQSLLRDPEWCRWNNS